MPYTVKKTGRGKYTVTNKRTGKVRARNVSMRGVRGVIWHSEHPGASSRRRTRRKTRRRR